MVVPLFLGGPVQRWQGGKVTRAAAERNAPPRHAGPGRGRSPGYPRSGRRLQWDVELAVDGDAADGALVGEEADGGLRFLHVVVFAGPDVRAVLRHRERADLVAFLVQHAVRPLRVF